MEDEQEEDSLRFHALCGDHAHVERRKGNKVTHGILRPVREGQPINLDDGEFVSLEPRKGAPGVFNVTSHSGPARVASTKYRSGHDRIFGKKSKPSGEKKLNPRLN